jgi:hypothetical protein
MNKLYPFTNDIYFYIYCIFDSKLLSSIFFLFDFLEFHQSEKNFLDICLSLIPSVFYNIFAIIFYLINYFFIFFIYYIFYFVDFFYLHFYLYFFNDMYFFKFFILKIFILFVYFSFFYNKSCLKFKGYIDPKLPFSFLNNLNFCLNYLKNLNYNKYKKYCKRD